MARTKAVVKPLNLAIGKSFGLPMSLEEYMKALSIAPVRNYDSVSRLPTGSLKWDFALGGDGGLPRGRVTTLSGEEHQGKTTLALMIAANIALVGEEIGLPNGGKTCYVDFENAYDPDWGDKLGIDKSKFFLFQPERKGLPDLTAEQMIDFLQFAAETNAFDFYVIDTIAEAVFAAQMEASMEKSVIGIPALKWGQFLRKFKGTLKKTDATLLALNQLREKIGVMYGSPLTEPGGRSWRFAASVRLRMHKKNDESTVMVGGEKCPIHVFRPHTMKNKTATKHDAEIRVVFIKGVPYVDTSLEAAELGNDLGVFVKEDGSPISGSCYWFFNGRKIAQGKQSVANALRQDDDLLDEVIVAIRAAMLLLNKKAPTVDPALDLEDGVIDADLEEVTDEELYDAYEDDAAAPIED